MPHTAKELAADAELHAQVQVLLALERMIQWHNERVVGRGKDGLFSKGALDLVAFHHLLFGKH